MALSNEIIAQLSPQDRGISFPVDSSSPDIAIDEVSTFDTIAPSMASKCLWKPKSDDIANFGDPTVIRCELITATFFDSEVTRTIINNQVLELTGQYGFDSFPNVTYKFKDTEKNEIISGSGLPFPADNEYFKNLIEFGIDERSNRDIFYTVDFVVEFDYAQIAFEFVDEILLETGGALLRDDNNDSPIGRVVKESSQRQTDVPIFTTTDSPEDPDLDGVINYDLYVEGTKAYRRDRFLFNQTIRNFTGENIGALVRAAL